MTTIKHAGAPVAVVPTEVTTKMADVWWRTHFADATQGDDTSDRAAYRAMTAAAPSEPGADLVELIGALRDLLDMNVESAKGLGFAPARLRGVVRARAALAKWETPDAG